jgi:hypothetical protein
VGRLLFAAAIWGWGCGDAGDVAAGACAQPVVLRAESSTGGGYEISADDPERYPCFVFASPFAPGEQITGWAPVIDSGTLHHWLLYRTTTAMPEGVVEDCRLPADAQLLMAWSPGGDAVTLPSDVGLAIAETRGEQLVLAAHYLNATGSRVVDHSGVELCRADTPRPRTAGVLILGTSSFEIPARATAYEVRSSCLHRGEQPLSVFAASPHMHRLGRALRTEIARGGATEDRREALIEVDDFDHDRQTTHAITPAVPINPGDRLHTTCTYDNPGDTPVRYGIGLDDEMCLDYLLVDPAEALPPHHTCI